MDSTEYCSIVLLGLFIPKKSSFEKMASFMAAQLPSEDEEDLDFNPAHEIDTDEEAEKNKTKKKTAVNRRRRGGGGIGLEEDEDDSDKEEGEKDTLEKVTKAVAADKAKADDIWASLNAGISKSVPHGNGQGKFKRNAKESMSSIESLCQSIARKKKAKKNQDAEWMRQLGIGNMRRKDSKKDSRLSTDEIAANALAAVKDANNVKTDTHGMITIEETRRFAGKNIVVQREVDKDSKEAKLKAGRHHTTKKEGLDAVLEQIAPAKKVTVMDKSKSDWKDYKTKDDQVLEELEAHKKSGGTYLEKKDFLASADLKAYEKERDARLGADVRNRGRL